MRTGLKKINKSRRTFIGVFKRYGNKKNWHGFLEKTILLIDIKDSSGVILSDHIWFNMTDGFKKLGDLKEGDIIKFDARVKIYVKGYKGYRDDVQFEKPLERDYKLNNPSKIRLIKRGKNNNAKPRGLFP